MFHLNSYLHCLNGSSQQLRTNITLILPYPPIFLPTLLTFFFSGSLYSILHASPYNTLNTLFLLTPLVIATYSTIVSTSMNFYFEATKALDRLDAKKGSIKSVMSIISEKDRRRTAALIIETLKCKCTLNVIWESCALIEWKKTKVHSWK